MNWKPEVKVGGAWSPNSQVFATRKEAEQAAQSLMMRWFAVTDTRAVATDDEVTYAIRDDKEVRL